MNADTEKLIDELFQNELLALNLFEQDNEICFHLENCIVIVCSTGEYREYVKNEYFNFIQRARHEALVVFNFINGK